MSSRSALHSARLGGVVASAAVLTTTVVVAGIVTPGYRPLVDAVSRLGSSDEPHASILRTGLVLYGALVLAGAGALGRVVPGRERIVACLIGTFGVASVVASLAPKDPPGSTHTLVSRIHVDADIVGGAMLLAAMMLVARYARLRADRRTASIALTLTTLGVIAFPFTWGAAPYGLVELLLLATASTWLVALALRTGSFDPSFDSSAVLVADGVGDAVEVVGPAVAVDDVVVERTQEHEVVHRGGSSGLPGPDVMHLAPVRLPVAAGVAAPTVTVADRSAQPAGRGAMFTADIERLAVGTEDDPRDVRVAEQPVDLMLRQR